MSFECIECMTKDEDLADNCRYCGEEVCADCIHTHENECDDEYEEAVE